MGKRHALNAEIADAYFGREKKSPTATKRPLVKLTLPITAIALFLSLIICLSLFISFSRRYASQKIKSEPPPISSQFNTLIEGGMINRVHVKRLSFDGDAKAKSALLKDGIMLVNDGSLNWASLNLELNKPVDFKNSFLFIKGKTDSGIKYLDLILVDSENKTYRAAKIPFSPRGEMRNVPLDKGAQGNIDLGGVAKVRVEFGTDTAGNAQGTTFYIKDLYLRKFMDEGGIR